MWAQLRLPVFVALLLVAASGCGRPASLADEATAADAGAYVPQVGDVLFQSSPHGPLIDTIEGVTQSPFSHCGIVAERAGKWVVIEAVEAVTETKLDSWIARGRGGAFAVYRFTDGYREKIPTIIAAARKHLNKPYDIRYQFDDEKIYCSELIYKAFRDATGEELGTVQKLGDLNWKPHEAYIRFLERGDLPLERRMITPRAVAEAKQLQLVLRKRI